MRRRTKITIEPRQILIACTVVLIILIAVSFKYQEKLEPVKTAVGNVVSPMQRGINSVGEWISDRLSMFTTMEALLEENEGLKEKLASVSEENKILQLEKQELSRLRKLFDLDQKYPDYPKVAANVIDKDTGNWYNNFIIDKGSDDGIAVDMNVMAAGGLVGIVTEVGSNWARVRAVIDDKSSVSATLLKTSDDCIVNGNRKLDGLLEVKNIKKDVRVSNGDQVVTSLISPKYLPGILIGYIEDITVDASNLTKSGKITPAVNFDKLNTVLIITQLKEQRTAPESGGAK